MKRTGVLLFVLVSAIAVSGDPIHVIPLRRASAIFKCGDRCQFRGSVPATPLRLRIFRGTINQLAGIADDPRYHSAGCVEFYSTIIRPRRSGGSRPLLNLNFYFKPPAWLASDGSNGRFVFVLERDDHPNGPDVEPLPVNLKLSISQMSQYFRSGVDVTVVPPVHSRPTRTRSRTASDAPATATFESGPPRDAPAAAVTTQVAMRPTPPQAADNCNDLLFDQAQPVLFERAGLTMKTPTQLSSARDRHAR
jgi:hypothetical protein